VRTQPFSGPWQAALAALLFLFPSSSCGGGNGQAVQTPVGSHVVDLSWTASMDTVVGYYVYRATTSGGPYVRLNFAAETQTAYADNAVQSGKTYYYVVTSVDTNQVESIYSNQVTAVIPTP
jgi:fibronectin type 3 domain-containing protein